MSSPLRVTIVRAGNEVGTYELAEVLRLLGAGTLKPTDLYWHEGMVGWELVSKLDTSEGLKLPAEPEVKRQSNNIFFACGGCGLLIFLPFFVFSVYFYSIRPLSREYGGTPNYGDMSEGFAYICGAISLLGLCIVILNVCIFIFRKK
jgi:hypothetical protein